MSNQKFLKFHMQSSKNIHSKWSFTSLLIWYSKRMYLAPAKSWSDYLSAVFSVLCPSAEKRCAHGKRRKEVIRFMWSRRFFFCHSLPSLFRTFFYFFFLLILMGTIYHLLQYWDRLCAYANIGTARLFLQPPTVFHLISLFLFIFASSC